VIQSYSYLIDIEADSFEETASKVRACVGRITRVQAGLRGLKVQQVDSGMRVTLRVAGLTRWHISHDAPRILNIILRNLQIPVAKASFEELTTEHGRGHLRYGQGRTEMTKHPRSERMSDGAPWDHIAWWGDDLPQEP
jgi:hypothetical protein